MAQVSDCQNAAEVTLKEEPKLSTAAEPTIHTIALATKAEVRDENEAVSESVGGEEREKPMPEKIAVTKNSVPKSSPSSRRNKVPKSPQRSYAMPENAYPPSYPGSQRGPYMAPHGIHGRPPAPGPYGPPPGPYYGGPHDFRGGPPPPYHQMPPLPHPGQYNGGYGHPPNMAGRPGPYHPPYGAHSYPSGHPGMGYHPGNPHHHHGNFPPPMNPSHSMDNNSISSARSKGSRGSKKRTIDDTKDKSHAYSFRRTNSNASTNTTGTHGNNAMDHHPLKQESGNRKKNLGSDNIFDQDRYSHRRQYSGASTTSSLSAGGFSLQSFEGPRCKINA